MRDKLITFETAKLAKEKGFDTPFIFAPSQSYLQQWLREKHNIEIAVQWFDKCYIKAVNKKPFKANTYKVEGFQSYEEALEIALVEGLNLI